MIFPSLFPSLYHVRSFYGSNSNVFLGGFCFGCPVSSRACPSCLQGLTRYCNDLQNGLLEADYIVVEMANQILGEDWMPKYVAAANTGGIERVLV